MIIIIKQDGNPKLDPYLLIGNSELIENITQNFNYSKEKIIEVLSILCSNYIELYKLGETEPVGYTFGLTTYESWRIRCEQGSIILEDLKSSSNKSLIIKIKTLLKIEEVINE